MSAGYYLGRDLQPYNDKALHKQRRRDKTYWLIRNFGNGRFNVRVEWVGGPFSTDVPTQHAMPYRVIVENITTHDYEGKLYPEPKVREDPEKTQFVRSEKQAINLYEHILAEWEAGEFLVNRDTGATQFCERGNLYRLPSKDEPTMPVEKPGQEVPTEVLERMGSW